MTRHKNNDTNKQDQYMKTGTQYKNEYKHTYKDGKGQNKTKRTHPIQSRVGLRGQGVRARRVRVRVRVRVWIKVWLWEG
jgi:hypothetical protein